MIFNFSHGSFARVFGIPVFGDAYEKWYWHAFIWPVYRIREDTEEEEAQRKELYDLECRISEEETEMLKRLVEIRGGLWT